MPDLPGEMAAGLHGHFSGGVIGMPNGSLITMRVQAFLAEVAYE